MPKLVWDQSGERLYETGVDRGVLYVPNNGVYSNGFAWNGLTAVTEAPSGAEPTPMYADNIKYLNLLSREDFAATIEAFTYPLEFAQHDGTANPQAGVSLAQQTRKLFGLAYRSRLGNDQLATDYGYKLHMIYGALAAPSERAYATINDSPEAVTFSWELSTTEVNVTGYKPTALVTIDSTKVAPANLLALEDALYGTTGTNPRLPLPDEIIGMFAGALTSVTAVAPAYNNTTKVIGPIPTVTGITYRREDTNAIVAAGASITLLTGQSLIIKAYPNAGFRLTAGTDDDFGFTF